MNESILDWLETDDFDTYGESLDDDYGDSLYEGEDLDAELYGEDDSAESRASKRRAKAARARRVAALARRRKQAQQARSRMNTRGRAPAGGRRPSASPPEGREIEKAQQGIEKVELESQVQGDLFSRALNVHQRRLGRSEQAFAISKVLDELKLRMPDLIQDDAIRTAVGLAPLLVLAPERKGKGVESLIADPRVWSSLLIAGIAIFARNRPQSQVVKMATGQINIPSETNEFLLTASVVDRNGLNILPQPKISWESSAKDVATVDDTGLVKRATKAGVTFITASAPNAQTGQTTVIVEPSSIFSPP
jgi:hypothetical protein